MLASLERFTVSIRTCLQDNGNCAPDASHKTRIRRTRGDTPYLCLSFRISGAYSPHWRGDRHVRRT